MSLPSVKARVSSALRPRVCNTKMIVAANAAQQISSQDNNKQGVIIQNQSAAVNVFVTFNQGSTSTNTTLRIVPGGSLSFDFAVAEALYVFTTAPNTTAECVVLEVSGFDTYQLLTAQLLEIIADNTAALVNIAKFLIRGKK